MKFLEQIGHLISFLLELKSNLLFMPTMYITSLLYASHFLLMHFPNKFNPIDTFLHFGASEEKCSFFVGVKLSISINSRLPIPPAPYTLCCNST